MSVITFMLSHDLDSIPVQVEPRETLRARAAEAIARHGCNADVLDGVKMPIDVRDYLCARGHLQCRNWRSTAGPLDWTFLGQLIMVES